MSGGLVMGGAQGPTGAAGSPGVTEEDTTSFSMDLVGNTTAGTTTYSGGVNVAHYVKIGKIVSLDFAFQVASHTGTGTIKIGPLPYTARPLGVGSIAQFQGGVNKTNNVVGVQEDGDYLVLTGIGVGSATGDAPVLEDQPASFYLQGSITYRSYV